MKDDNSERTPDDAYRLGFEACTVVRAAYDAYQNETLEGAHAQSEKPELKKIDNVPVADLHDLHSFATKELKLTQGRMSSVTRAWGALYKLSQNSREEVRRHNIGNEPFVFDHTVFFDEAAALEAGLEGSVYINLDELHIMIRYLLRSYSRAPTTFDTNVIHFGIGGVILLARFLNYHLRPEEPLVIPNKSK